MKRTRFPLCLAGLWLMIAAAACTQAAGLDGHYVEANQPCESNADCSSGICNGTPGWCTAYCSADADCPAGACIENGESTYTCFPACSTSADCAVYGVVGLSCLAVTSIGGGSALICTAPPS